MVPIHGSEQMSWRRRRKSKKGVAMRISVGMNMSETLGKDDEDRVVS